MDTPDLHGAAEDFRNARRELIACEKLFETSRSQDAASEVVAAQARLEEALARLRRLARRGFLPF